MKRPFWPPMWTIWSGSLSLETTIRDNAETVELTMSTSADKIVDALRASLLENKRLQRKNQQLVAASTEPIAIIGMSCRLPGGVFGPDQLWDLVADGRDAISGFPSDRGWDLEGLHGTGNNASATAEGGFLTGAGEFDAGFFGISPREALAMDPQQRLLLETSWEALEHAGIDPLSLAGGQVGVFAGASPSGYVEVADRSGDDVAGHLITGGSQSVISGRVAYTLGLQGPAMTVDTACSSSLVALHLAVQALRSEECSMALVGGTAVMATPDTFVGFSQQGGLAADGRCKAFADSADGTGWAEGSGVLVVQRLSDARRDGRRVLAVVRSSAVNQDGASNGLTAPNGPAQQRVIRQALVNGGLSTADVDVVEGHGTGTVLGDPIEAQALLATYGQGRPDERPLWLGSLKSNIGHAQAAAGVAGVIKMVMALRHGVLPPTLHVDAPSAKVDWSRGAVRLLTESTAWPETDRPRRAGVSSFGVSGTNAHVILEAVAETGTANENEPEAEPDLVLAPPVVRGAVPWVLSGKTAEAVRGQAARLLDWAEVNPGLESVDVGRSLVTSRALFDHRVVVTGGDRAELLAGLRAVVAGEPVAQVVQGAVAGSTDAGVVFVFPGQGGQWVGMARELMDVSPVFAAAMAECAEALGSFVEWSLWDVLGDEVALGRVEVVQPVLWAVMVSLAKLWRSCGVVPVAVVGHSQGEIAALCVAGGLSLSDGARVVALRSRAIADTLAGGGGGMAAVALPVDRVVVLVERWGGRLSLAAVNGPLSVVVSGDVVALRELVAECEADGVRARMIAVDYASHSAQVEEIRDRLLEELASVRPQAQSVPVYSSVTGGLLDAATADAAYWVRNLRETVRFEEVTQALIANGYRAWLEVGPHPVLTAAVQETLDEAGEAGVVMGTLRRGEGGARRMVASLAELFVHGGHVSWEAVFAGVDIDAGSSAGPGFGSVVDLPTYAFQHERYWPDTPAGIGDVIGAGLASAGHPLLGAMISLPQSGGTLFTGRISLRSHPWLADHVVRGVAVFPGTGFVELAIRAGDAVGCDQVGELVLEAPLVMPAQGGCQIQLLLTEERPGHWTLAVHARPDTTDAWTRHATGVLTRRTTAVADASAFADLGSGWPPTRAKAIDTSGMYSPEADFDTGSGAGPDVFYGPVFQGLTQAWRQGDRVWAEVALPESRPSESGPFGIHPALLDSVLHAAMLTGSDASEPVRLPFTFTDVVLWASGATRVRVCLTRTGEDDVSVVVADDTGSPVLSIGSLLTRPLPEGDFTAGLQDTAVLAPRWIDVDAAPSSSVPSAGDWAVVGQDTAYPNLDALITALDGGTPVPRTVLLAVPHHPDAAPAVVPGLAHQVTVWTLEQLQRWLGEPRLGDTRLAVVTKAAVTTGEDDPVLDLPAAAVWGLVRSAQSENPDRITLIDLETYDDLGPDLAAPLRAVATGEPQVAVRGTALRVPRLIRHAVALPGPPDGTGTDGTGTDGTGTDGTGTGGTGTGGTGTDGTGTDGTGTGGTRPDGFGTDETASSGTVLITGGTGGLGGLTARHLVRAYGVRHLLLVSRGGERSDGAAELVAELTGLGAQVTVAACDVTDRKALAGVLATVPAEHPLSGVVHTAGVLDDGVIGSLTADRVDRVLAPKVDASWHLHELTRELDLSLFVVFSSLSGLLGSPGQGNYAAGNVFADTVVQWRRQLGLPALSMAWGAWTPDIGLTGTLSEIDLRRMSGTGMPPLAVAQGLDLFDQAIRSDEAVLGLTRLDLVALRGQADLPPVLRSLVPGGVARPSVGDDRQDPDSFTRRWAGIPAKDRPGTLMDLIRAHVAAVLGHSSAAQIDTSQAFKTLGFDSLTAVELRNRLAGLTGLRLPATLVFDYPTIDALAGHVAGLLGDAPAEAGQPSLPPVVSVTDDPIVIVGMACRFPGDVSGPDDLWRLVADGRDAVSDFPADRGWDLDELYGPDGPGSGSGASVTAKGGFLAGVGEFDAGFFGISPREAVATDPQQRLLLETSWEALEHAGIAPASIAGSSVGVFVGAFESGYTQVASRSIDDVAGHLVTGGSQSVLSGRVAYTLGLHGPAVTVDTACSSSLVALHWAGQALRSGECSMALVGGVTVMATADAFVGFSVQGGLAADGRCKAFADGADGTGWSEGAGVLVVQRLSDARREGRRVLAVVRSSAVNQDGASNGLTAPNGPAQQRVIRQALAGAGLSAAEVDVVEAHGTGTVLGDPIEAQALIAAYGQDRPAGHPLLLGSLKSNLGHTQAAAGVAGVIKMVMAMRHGVLPRTLHVDAPSSKVDWSEDVVRLLTETTSWPETGRPRRVGVSSFGVSGTNAHVILEAPEAADLGETDTGLVPAPVSGTEVAVPWVVSGKSPDAVRAQAARLAAWAEAAPDLDVRDAALSLAVTRSVFDHRTAVAGAGREELLAGLRAVAEGTPTAQVFQGSGPLSGGVGVLFSGQGAQRLGMGRRLYESSAVFAGALDVVVAELELHVGRSLTEVMWGGDAGLLEGTGWAQPALFAVEVALFRVVESWGVVVDYVLGHSVGEIAAAYVSGVLSLGDACRLVVARGGLMQALPAGGAMVAVEAGEDEVAGLLSAGVSIAAVNSPGSLVLAGAEGEVTRIAEGFAGRGRRTNRLRVSHAFHSPLMEPMLAEFEQVLGTLVWGAPRIAVVSALTGELVDAEVFSAPAYWVRQVREAVRFADGVRRLESLGVRTLIEVGPNGALAAMAQHTCTDEVAAVALLRGDDQPEDTALAAGAARLFARGVPLAWDQYFAGAQRTTLPTYAFQRQRYWPEAAGGVGDVVGAGLAAAEHPLLGAMVALPDSGGMLFTGKLSLHTHPWLADHVVRGSVVFPGTGFVELAVRAGDTVGCGQVSELVLEAPLVLPAQGGCQIQIVLTEQKQQQPREQGRWTVAVHARPDGGDIWTRHATGVLTSADSTLDTTVYDALSATWPPAGASTVDISGMYADEGDVVYGPVFQGLTRVFTQGNRVWAEAELPEVQAESAKAFGIHPALLDAVVQAVRFAELEPADSALLPFMFGEVVLRASAATRVRVCLTRIGTNEVSIAVADGSGTPVLSIGSLSMRPLPEAALGSGSQDALVLVPHWTDREFGPVARTDDWTVLGADPDSADYVNHVNHADWDALVSGLGTEPSLPGCVVLVVPHTFAPESFVTGAHEITGWVLEQLQRRLADRRFDGTRLIVVTRGAVTTKEDDPITDLPGAAVWGLVRSAQSENPDRIILADLEPGAALDLDTLARAVGTGEPQLALRGGGVRVPRLLRHTSTSTSAPASSTTGVVTDTVTVGRPVLVTGGTGGLGGLVALHLVRAYGVRSLVLASRQGEHAHGASDLATELAEWGARVTVVACDVSDREALAGLLAEHPVSGVVHTAGVVDDGVIGSLTGERIDAVLAPKADATWLLHELTRSMDLSLFVVFSSLAGLLGGPGQGNYAAGNVFADAVVQWRRQAGLPGVSMVWGPWTPEAGLTGALAAADLERLRASGMPPMPVAQGLDLFDRALTAGEPVVALTRLEPAVLRTRDDLGPMLRSLVPTAVARPAAGDDRHHPDSFARRWTAIPAEDRTRFLHDLLRGHVAQALGHLSPQQIDQSQAFRALGFDSLTAVELRNRLATVTGLRLPATLVFDYPTITELAGHMATLLGDASAGIGSGVGTGALNLPPVVSVTDDPIVIVGMACRFPGDVSNADQLWGLVAEGRDAVSAFPTDRGWDLDELFGAGAGASVTGHGGFLAGVGEFDAGFFGISPREAVATDPQQRLLLETSWEALEHAGIAPASLTGTPVGVFVGAFPSGYAEMAGRSGDDVAGHLITGGSQSVVSGRVAYTLGLQGPAMTVDTACSSSLVALHLAAQALRSGECTMALAGGVTVMATPDTFVGFTQQGGMAADGRCKAFADAADGTGWSEGAGVLVVQRLSDARREGRRVLAVVRSSAVNQDGASNGLTAPNGPAQQRVIRQALAGAGLSAAEVDVVEGHGTGTVLGDPIEAQALLATYGQGRPEDRPLWLGSLKSNLGHTQAAAGVAGIIKMVMAMRHGVLPPTLHVDAPSSKVDWTQGTVRLLTEATPWPETGRPRRAGVSAFGVSGTNAHVILEAPAETAAEDETAEADPASGLVRAVVPWVLSGRTADAVRGQAARLLDLASADLGLDVLDTGWSLAATRSVFEHRAVVTGADRDELLAGLRALVTDTPATQVVQGQAPVSGGVGVLFSGQGAQRLGMGRRLYVRSAVFAEALDAVAAELDLHVDRSLTEVMWGDDAGLLEATGWAQPALFAVEVALFRVVESWGVVPDYVLGHSVGEVAAAYVSGVLSLADACRLVVARGRLMQALPAGGAMVAVQGAEDEFTDVLSDRVSVAAVNGPDSVVLAGDETEVLEIAEMFGAMGRRTSRLRVSHAFHSSLMEPMLAEFEQVLGTLVWGAPRIAVVSALTGELVDAEVFSAPAYWVRQVRETVRFADGVRRLESLGVRTLIEAGPGGVLAAMAQQTCTEAVTAVALLRGDDHPEDTALVEAAARLFTVGAPLTWEPLFAGAGARWVELPTYAFQRRRYWPTIPTTVGDVAAAGLRPAEHPFLGAMVALPESGGTLLTGKLSLHTHPWLADHVVQGKVVFPGTGFVELAVRAGDAVGCDRVVELVLETPLVLSSQGGCQIQVVLTEREQGWAVAVHACPDGGETWTRHASGVLTDSGTHGTTTAGDGTVFDGAWPPDGASAVDTSGIYGSGADTDLAYGPAFQGLTRAWTQGDRVWAEVELPEPQRAGAGAFGVHPALLDAVLHAATFAGLAPAESARLPFMFTEVELTASGATRVRVCLTRTGADEVSVAVADRTGAPVLSIGSLLVRQLPAGTLGVDAQDTVVLTPHWTDVSATDRTPLTDDWTTVGPSADYADLAALSSAVEYGMPVPRSVVLVVPRTCESGSGFVVGRVHEVTGWVLEQVQGWLGAVRLVDSRLVVVTRGAVTVGGGDVVTDLPGAAVWGLVRSAQSENPDRIVLVDLDSVSDVDAGAGAGSGVGVGSGSGVDLVVVAGAVACGESQVVVRGGVVRVLRLVEGVGVGVGGLVPPVGGLWRLESVVGGSLEGLSLVAVPGLAGVLGVGEVRVGVRAAGVNFRDVLSALGMYPGDAGLLGGEVAGVVLEVGSGVSRVGVGDRVLGMVSGGFGPVVVADERLVVGVPEGWSFVEAAGVPIAFLTAYYGLVDLAGVVSGESLLVHAGAGGVGMAAIQLARHFGLEVFATASESKWGVLRSLGVDGDRIGSSRSLGFEERFLGVSGGRGVDVVLNSLAGEFVDASLRVLADRGRFIEMGKTDVRSVDDVQAVRPGVGYQAFDLIDAGPERIGEMLGELMVLFEAGVLCPLPVVSSDVRQARGVFRLMSQARHTGKLVLTMPGVVDSAGTVVVTGGTGGLGSVVARHLVRVHGVRHVVLVSRRGAQAEGAAELVEDLTELGARATVVACDVSDRSAVAALLAAVPDEHPITGVVHTAGVLDDGVIGSLTGERLDRVLAPKVDATWHLHDLTREKELSFFVVFSSLAGLLGGPGQANYAAGNVFADTLVQWRRQEGLPGVSMAWGSWTTEVGLTGTLSDLDLERMAGAGMLPLSVTQGLDLFDQALLADRAVVGLTRWRGAAGLPMANRSSDVGGGRFRRNGSRHEQPGSGNSFTQRWAAVPVDERAGFLLELVRGHAAAVLGHASPDAIGGGQVFRDLGFDSLTAVELRNRLATATGLSLPATLVFDHPTPGRVVTYLHEQIKTDEPSPTETVLTYLNNLKATLHAVAADAADRDRIAERLREILDLCGESEKTDLDDVATATDEDLFAFVDQGID
ncbi:SDR family NAD(P)-dependent oxidoreductase [Streptomyces zagrosensis]